MKKKTKSTQLSNIKVGDKVWWYHPQAVEDVININKTHAHLRNIHGVMSWVPIEKLKKINETESASPVERIRAGKD